MRKTSHPPKQMERPVIFKAEMVRAILDGRKTQTRRIVKVPPAPMKLGVWEPSVLGCAGTKYSDGTLVPERIWKQPTLWHTRNGKEVCCPYGVAGDRLYVRETFEIRKYGAIQDAELRYSDGSRDYRRIGSDDANKNYRPRDWRKISSIHMPRWASRVTLEITGVRVERLQDISEEDAVAEGSEIAIDSFKPSLQACFSERAAFRQIWERINGVGAWDKNAWCWVVEFRRVLSDPRGNDNHLADQVSQNSSPSVPVERDKKDLGEPGAA